MPPALAESRAGDNGGSPGHSAASGEAQQGAAPAEMPGSLSLGPGAAAWGRRQLGLRWEKPGRGDPDTRHVYPAPGSDRLSLCPSLPQHPESSAAGSGVALSRLLTDESLTSRPKKRKNCPQLSCAQVFAGSMVFEVPGGAAPGERSRNRAAACTCWQAVECVQRERATICAAVEWVRALHVSSLVRLVPFSMPLVLRV